MANNYRNYNTVIYMSSVIGLATLLAAFDKLEKDIQEDIKDVVEEVTLGIEYDAKANAPRAGDKLETQHVSSNKSDSRFKVSGSIRGYQTNPNNINQYITSVILPNGLTGIVQVDSGATKLVIYIEFGTGTSAAGYVPTLPQEFQDIARKFYINGKGTLIKKPFLLPAYFKYEPIFLAKMKNVLQDVKLK